jgi:hypothetical protein
MTGTRTEREKDGIFDQPAYLEEDTDTQIHEWLREINDALARIVDGHRADGEIRFLELGQFDSPIRSLIVTNRRSRNP